MTYTQKTYQGWQLNPLDTWFFREAKPFDTIGSPELPSQFPPPAPTVAGAIKTAIGRQLGINWHQFKPKAETDTERHEVYGQLGDLSLCGPFISLAGKPLFPAPAFLLHQKDHGYHRLIIGNAVETDLGIVCLPELPPDAVNKGFKPLEHAWLTAEGYTEVLAGGLPKPEQVKRAHELYSPEPRLGIGRDNQTGCVNAEDSLLYQTCHIRPGNDVALWVGVAGLAAQIKPEPVRLGGEGRLTLMSASEGPVTLPSAPVAPEETRGFILILLTPADLDSCWRLPNAQEICPERDSGEGKRWTCTLNGVELTIHAAVLGKPVREGGWHLAERKPRRVESFVPAGSAWFCTARNMNAKQAINALHLTQIGDGQKLGRGLLAAGVWNSTFNHLT